MQFTNKVVLITGSTSGIGKAIAVTFAHRGALVAIHGRDKEAGEKVLKTIQKYSEGIYINGDLEEKKTPAKLVRKVIDRWGRIDVLVNNAAMIHHSVIGKIEGSEWDQLFTVNLKTPFFLIQESLPYLKKHKGIVINISSLNAIKNAKNNFIYDSLKAALNHMTSGLALDLRNTGIRMNTVMPAGTATPLLNKVYHQQFNDFNEAETRADAVKNNESTSSPQEIANIVLFLASSEALWINGTHIRADGGFHL